MDDLDKEGRVRSFEILPAIGQRLDADSSPLDSDAWFQWNCKKNKLTYFFSPISIQTPAIDWQPRYVNIYINVVIELSANKTKIKFTYSILNNCEKCGAEYLNDTPMTPYQWNHLNSREIKIVKCWWYKSHYVL